MDLIVTHNNADFDAFSSLVAARKLYPHSKLLLPGSQERAVREFLSLVKDKINIEKERTCDFRGIKRLVIVDTRHKSRIGMAGELLGDPSLEVHIYDHHPRSPHDIKADKDVFQEVGATVSILIDILRKQKSLKISPLEATIMLLGIYEETGSLTYRTTTSLDVDTVSFLLSKGANLQAVSSYLNRKLTEEELTFLTALIASTKIITVNGVNISIARGTIKHFIGELGTIVRKLQDVENFPVLFVLFEIGKKVRIIARSRLKEVDVNRTLAHFGGGGHRSAASAKIDGTDIATVEKKLTDILRTSIKAKIFAQDIMSYPVKVIPSGKNIQEAKNMLEKLRLKGAPVTEGARIAGIITNGDIQKAVKFNYAHASVKGYMSRNVVTISPDAPLHTIQKIMFENNIGRLPVLKNRKLVGIVTRTDVLKSVHKDIFFKRKPSYVKRRAQLNISTKMKRLLPRQILDILRTIGQCANHNGLRAFVVGGFVRDVLLNVRNYDIDIVVEGDAISFGRKLADILKGSLVAYRKFGTSTVIMEWPKGLRKPQNGGKLPSKKGSLPHAHKFKIDFATARKESYEKPAALPTVFFSSLKDDLQRRDFTINAMAASLNRNSFGQLIDFFGGEKDLENGVIRVLHDGSFIDDPTRIFRAVRFEQRFNFCIDRYTERLIKNAIHKGMFSKTQHHRIRDELILILQEEYPAKAIVRMKNLHELRFVHSKIRVGKHTVIAFSRIKDSLKWYTGTITKRRHIDLWLIYFMALLENLNTEEARYICDKFALRSCDRTRLLSCKKNAKNAALRISKKAIKPSSIYSILEPMSFEEILFLRSKLKNKMALSRIGDFFSKYNRVRIKMGGEDIKKLGITPGPMYAKILNAVLRMKIDEKVTTKKDELEFAKKLVKRYYYTTREAA
ncbi:MAG: CBS domain-containing protein [Candidatus Omnitrophica bacterium]|nr:CBS domain-containing protein [Candidatus Omnitrophota bacterium]